MTARKPRPKSGPAGARAGGHAAGRGRPPDRVLTDPQAIRALAHPARLTILEALSDGDPMTATECAAVAGISPSAMSYHLRALEKWGFVERAESSGDGRERPWRATGGRWQVDSIPDPLAATASSAVVASMLDRVRTELHAWFEHERDEPQPWRDVGGIWSSPLWLTVDEVAQLEQVMDQFIEEHRGRTAADHPEGARRVRVSRVIAPIEFD